MSVAQFGIWLSFSVWVTLLTFSIVKLCRFHHQENLRVSMAKERKRLLNEDLISEVPVNPPQPSERSQRDQPPSRMPSHRGGRRFGGTNNSGGTAEHDEAEEVQQQFEEVSGAHKRDNSTASSEHHISESGQQTQAQVVAATSPQQHSPLPQAPPPAAPTHDLNISYEDGSASSMTSSQHSYNSLPKGNQIHFEQHKPDLLK